MINFDYLEQNLDEYKYSFNNAIPFEHIVIDSFCDAESLRDAVSKISNPIETKSKKSRDFIFAKNKYEKADFNLISSGLSDLKTDLLSERFQIWLSELTSQQVFVDPQFHGGGLHQGGQGSFLDMHVDFDYHPVESSWFRNLNILLYLNEFWKEGYGGELKLIDGRADKSQVSRISPLFNRAVIMFTRDYTMHGYDPINFPDGKFRSSIAAYAYTKTDQEHETRTTIWFPERGGPIKRFLGKHMPRLVSIKSRFFGSGTTKNK